MDQKEKQIEITVVIPTYNSENFVKRAISSIQSFLSDYSYEILVIDDGSTDETKTVVESFLDKHINLIVKPHNGVSYCRNIGIKEAKGTYIMFCDSDDYLIGKLPSIKLEEDIISFSQNCRRNKTFKTHKEKIMLIESLFGFNASSIDFPAIYGGSVSKLFNLAFLRKQSIQFDTKLTNSEDLLFNIQSILKATSVRTITQGIYVYQQRLSSVTHSFDKNLEVNHTYFITQINRLLEPLSGTHMLLEQIMSLYTYQLVFRYWIYIKDAKSSYQHWRQNLKKNKLWNTKLNRPVEKITIYLMNAYGLGVTLYFARFYTFIKRTIQRRPQKLNIIL